MEDKEDEDNMKVEDKEDKDKKSMNKWKTKKSGRQKEEKTDARKRRKYRSQQRQGPVVKATFRLTAIIFLFRPLFLIRFP